LLRYIENTASAIPLGVAPEELNWYAIQTFARHEKRVAAHFEEKRVCTFLPLLHQIHRWSDRRSVVEIPMFSSYAFVRIVQTVDERLKVLRTPGVLGFVGSERQGPGRIVGLTGQSLPACVCSLRIEVS